MFKNQTHYITYIIAYFGSGYVKLVLPRRVRKGIRIGPRRVRKGIRIGPRRVRG